jgi:hypothetical protein
MGGLVQTSFFISRDFTNIQLWMWQHEQHPTGQQFLIKMAKHLSAGLLVFLAGCANAKISQNRLYSNDMILESREAYDIRPFIAGYVSWLTPVLLSLCFFWLTSASCQIVSPAFPSLFAQFSQFDCKAARAGLSRRWITCTGSGVFSSSTQLRVCVHTAFGVWPG